VATAAAEMKQRVEKMVKQAGGWYKD